MLVEMETNSLMKPALRMSLKVLTSLRWSLMTPRMLPVEVRRKDPWKADAASALKPENLFRFCKQLRDNPF